MTALTDHERLIDALRHLAPSVRTSADGSWRRPPALRVIDCVLSLNRNYDRFVVPRLDCFQRNFPEICSVGELNEEIARYQSAHEFVVKTLGYKHEARAVTLGSVASWLVTISGNGARNAQLAELECWARAAPSDGYRTLGIRGFGLAGFQYLRMLFGANTTKPDIRICEWVAVAVGHPISPVRALHLLERAAPEANINLRDADTTIWEMLARGHQTVRH
jgi:hypothetical protein